MKLVNVSECKFGENVCNNKQRWKKINVDVNAKN